MFFWRQGRELEGFGGKRDPGRGDGTFEEIEQPASLLFEVFYAQQNPLEFMTKPAGQEAPIAG